MKSNEVLKLLNITRPTLCKYVKIKKIRATKLANGLYDYDEDSVLKLLHKEPRKVAVYVRSIGQDINEQISNCEKYINDNKINGYKLYKDLDDGYNPDREQYKSLIFDIITFKIKTVIVPNMGILTLNDVHFFIQICKQFSCQIVQMNTNFLTTQNLLTEKYNAINKIINN